MGIIPFKSKRRKLSHFNEYYNIYSLSEDFIVKLLMGVVTLEECGEYNDNIKEAKYLLGAELNDFMIKIHDAGIKLWCLNDDVRAYEADIENLSKPYLIELKRFKSEKTELLKSIPLLRNELKKRFEEKLKID